MQALADFCLYFHSLVWKTTPMPPAEAPPPTVTMAESPESSPVPLEEPALAEGTLRFIDVVAQSVSTVITEQLVQATEMVSQSVTPPKTRARNSTHGLVENRTVVEREASMNKSLNDVLTRRPLYKLGARKTIAVDINPHLNAPPSSSSSPNATSDPRMPFSAPGRSPVPGKLVSQSSFERATRQPTIIFTKAFTGTTSSAVFRALTAKGQQVCNMFARAQQLHRLRHNINDQEVACVWRMVEEDFEWPHPELKGVNAGPKGKDVSRFAWKCEDCGGRRHHVLVWTSEERAGLAESFMAWRT